jgi:hypothetical protein
VGRIGAQTTPLEPNEAVREQLRGIVQQLAKFTLIFIIYNITSDYAANKRNRSVFSHPLLSAKRTVLRGSFFSPLQDAVEVKMMETLSLDGHAIISWHFAPGAGRLKCELANGAALLRFDIPLPSGNCVPRFDLNLHCLNIINSNISLEPIDNCQSQ